MRIAPVKPLPHSLLIRYSQAPAVPATLLAELLAKELDELDWLLTLESSEEEAADDTTLDDAPPSVTP